MIIQSYLLDTCILVLVRVLFTKLQWPEIVTQRYNIDHDVTHNVIQCHEYIYGCIIL